MNRRDLVENLTMVTTSLPRNIAASHWALRAGTHDSHFLAIFFRVADAAQHESLNSFKRML